MPPPLVARPRRGRRRRRRCAAARAPGWSRSARSPFDATRPQRRSLRRAAPWSWGDATAGAGSPASARRRLRRTDRRLAAPVRSALVGHARPRRADAGGYQEAVARRPVGDRRGRGRARSCSPATSSAPCRPGPTCADSSARSPTGYPDTLDLRRRRPDRREPRDPRDRARRHGHRARARRHDRPRRRCGRRHRGIRRPGDEREGPRRAPVTPCRACSSALAPAHRARSRRASCRSR